MEKKEFNRKKLTSLSRAYMLLLLFPLIVSFIWGKNMGRLVLFTVWPISSLAYIALYIKEVKKLPEKYGEFGTYGYYHGKRGVESALFVASFFWFIVISLLVFLSFFNG